MRAHKQKDIHYCLASAKHNDGFFGRNMKLRIKIISHEPDANAQDVQLDTPILVEGDQRIGRDSSCDIVLPCTEKAVSRHHAEILRRDEQYFFIDCSTNGSFHNNSQKPLVSRELIEISDNDQFHIGHYSLTCSLESEEKKPTITPADFGESANAVVIDEVPSMVPPIKDVSYDANLFAPSDVPNSAPFDPSPSAGPVFQSSPTPITGGLSESFAPPKAYIPEDWASALNMESSAPPVPTPTPSITPVGNSALNSNFSGATPAPAAALAPAPDETPSVLPKDTSSATIDAMPEAPPIPLPPAQNIGIESGTTSASTLTSTLLAALGLPPKALSASQNQATEQIMVQLLQILLQNTINVRLTQSALISALCEDDNQIAAFNTPSVLQNQSYQSFLTQLLQADPQAQQQLMAQLKGELQQQADDLDLLSDTLNTCMHTITDALNSERFEKAFQSKDAMMRPDRSPIHRALSQRNLAQRRWSFFRENWDQKIRSVIQTIKTEFQTKLLADRTKKQRR